MLLLEREHRNGRQLSEDRTGLKPDGGYVVTTTNRSLVRDVVVDEQTLDKIAELLGIPKAERDQLIPDTRSIYIYRGTTNRSP